MLRSFDLQQSQPVGLVETGLQLGADRQGELDGLWRHRCHEPLSDSTVDRGARDDLTHRPAPVHTPGDALIVGHEAAGTLMVMYRHSPATDAAEDQPLEQGRSLSRRRAPVVETVGQRRAVELLLVALEFVPVDVALVGIEHESVPLVTG